MDALSQRFTKPTAEPLVESTTDPISDAADASKLLPDNLAGNDLAGIIAELKTGDFYSRWDATKRLTEFGEAAVAPLVELLQTETGGDGDLLWFIARTLGNLRYPTAIAALVQLLRTTPEPEVTAMTATALINFGADALPALTTLMAQPDTRLVAVQALAQIQHLAVVPLLLQGTTDADPEIRAAVFEALGHFPYEMLAEPLAAAVTAALWTGLTDQAIAGRRAAVMALGLQAQRCSQAGSQVGSQVGSQALDTQALITALSPLLYDLNPEVGRQAALALSRVGSERAVHQLAEVLQSVQIPLALQIELVRVLAWTETAAAFEQIRGYLWQLPPLPLAQETVAVLGRVVAAPMRALATQILLDLLHEQHPISQTATGKQQIALSLGQLQEVNAINAVIDLLADAEISVQLHAIAALKQLAAQGSYEQLQARLANPGSAELKRGIQTTLQEWQADAS